MRIAELEAQIEAMIDQMPPDPSQTAAQHSEQLQQIQSERDAGISRIAELESQVEAMIEQIGSPADEAVIALEKDLVHLKQELQDAQTDNEATHAMAAEAVSVLEDSNRDHDALKLQVGCAALNLLVAMSSTAPHGVFCICCHGLHFRLLLQGHCSPCLDESQ